MRCASNIQRGSVAVEFALVTPIFLALVGAVFYFGLALYTRLLVLNAANTAVRSCVIRQVGNQSDGDFTSCASSEFTRLTGPAGGFSILCNGGTPQAQATFQPASFGSLRGNVKVLTLNVTCDVSMGTLMWMSSSGGGATIKTMRIATAMPYSLTRLSN